MSYEREAKGKALQTEIALQNVELELLQEILSYEKKLTTANKFVKEIEKKVEQLKTDLAEVRLIRSLQEPPTTDPESNSVYAAKSFTTTNLKV